MCTKDSLVEVFGIGYDWAVISHKIDLTAEDGETRCYGGIIVRKVSDGVQVMDCSGKMFIVEA